MLSADHPNAQNLSRYYSAMAAALNDKSADLATRQAAFTSIAEKIDQLMAPDFLIHTAGVRLASKGDRAFTMIMGKRRNILSGGTFRPLGAPLIVADDSYAFVRGTFGGERNGLRFAEETAGAWRFNADGQATEHWELGMSRAFDEFFIGCDPDFEFGTGREFWLKGSYPYFPPPKLGKP